MYILIRLIAGLCMALFFFVLMCIDERDRNKQQQTTTRTYKQIKRNKPNTITIKSIYWIMGANKIKKAILVVIFGSAFAFINSLQVVKLYHIYNTIGFNEYNISLMILSFIVLNIFIVGGYCLIRIDLKD